MNLRRVGILFSKELFQGPKNFLFFFALVIPVVFTLVVSLVFGTYFSGKSRLGIVDQGASALVTIAQTNQALSVSVYPSVEELQDSVARGSLDMGVILPETFDQQVRSGEQARLTVYVWGESQLRSRVILSSAIVNGTRQIGGQELPVEIVQTVLGRGVDVPWEKRLLPLMVLVTILLAGTMLPASSLVNEKTKRTLMALAASPATLLEVFAAKGLLGVTLSILSGVMILFLNRAFGGQPVLLVGVLALGAVLSASFGVLLGALVKDTSTLFATMKSIGILLYAPALIQMFPDLPQWTARIFPTYYIIGPVLQISQEGGGLAEVAPDLGILLGLIALSFLILARVAAQTQEALASA
jgi:ABC-2 type transport system permease protein